MFWWILIAAVVIIASLSSYALLLLRQVKRQNTNRTAIILQQERDAEKFRKQKNTSIQLIAQGALTNQLSLTEAAIRISRILDSLSINESDREEFIAFYHLAAATQHIPILDEWKKLKTKQQYAYDKQRAQLEADHKEFILDAAQRIINRGF